MSVLESGNVSLRAVEAEDIDFMLECENDAPAWRVSDTRAPFSRRLIERYVEGYSADPYAEGQLRLIIEEKGSEIPVGIIDLFDIETYHGRAKVGIYILPEVRKRGFGFDALNALCKYCIDLLGLRILSATILKDNKESEALFSKIGFENVATLKGWHRVGPDMLSVSLMIRYL